MTEKARGKEEEDVCSMLRISRFNTALYCSSLPDNPFFVMSRLVLSRGLKEKYAKKRSAHKKNTISQKRSMFATIVNLTNVLEIDSQLWQT